ncbi:MAG: oxidoreductase [Coriobacteriaceae bacterium]|jgi:anaerobic dimethyl sulfoxide reductase subunit B (iron-sulfur subunit)|nr:oxidoreductase [Coriobacteriaceae bacterium]
MADYGLLIDYEYCTGCESCVVACKEEHKFPVGKWGIRVFDDGPWQKDDEGEGGNHFNWNKIPVPTDLCDLCASRLAQGKEPTCVHHCLAFCMQFGTIEELAAKLAEKPKQVLWVPCESE